MVDRQHGAQRRSVGPEVPGRGAEPACSGVGGSRRAESHGEGGDALVERGSASGRGSRLGARVRAERRVRRLSLQQLADRAGCAKSYLSSIETGSKGPPGDKLLGRLEGALGLAAGTLIDLARWERTPGPLREGISRMSHQAAEGRELASLVRDVLAGGGLDAAHRSGELRRLVERLSAEPSTAPEGSEPVASALPLEVPVINSVAAGYPAGFTDLGFPARIADEYVRTADVGDPDAFAARVVGDSMSPDYREGDVVVFSPSREVSAGCDCFARLEPDHETTFKRVYFERDEGGRDMIRLQPINNAYPPRTVPREGVAGLYRAVSVTRSI